MHGPCWKTRKWNLSWLRIPASKSPEYTLCLVHRCLLSYLPTEPHALRNPSTGHTCGVEPGVWMWDTSILRAALPTDNQPFWASGCVPLTIVTKKCETPPTPCIASYTTQGSVTSILCFLTVTTSGNNCLPCTPKFDIFRWEIHTQQNGYPHPPYS